MGWRKKKIARNRIEESEGTLHGAAEQEQVPEMDLARNGLSGPELLADPRLSHPANAGRRAEALRAGQQTLGNQAVQRLLRSGAVQAKLTVNPPGDQYEREADRVADRVMRMPEPTVELQEDEELLEKPLVGAAQRQEETEEEEDLLEKPLAGAAQRQEELEEEEPLEAKLEPHAQVHLHADPEKQREEELVQAATRVGGLQRQVEPEEEEEEEPIEARLVPGALQRQVEPEEEEEPVQAKLVADQVQRQEEEEEEEPLQDKLAPGALQRQVEPEEEEEPVQAKGDSSQTAEVSPEVEEQIGAIRGGGRPLPESERSFFEPRMGHDLSQVRVHTDGAAGETARSLQAQAFTVGHDVVFGSGQYAPGTDSGRRLIAHELTHVAQQVPEEVAQTHPKAEKDQAEDAAKDDAQ